MIDKRWAVIGGVVVGLVLFFVLTAPFFVNAETFRPTIESQLSSALGRNVTLGKLTFSLFAGSLEAEDISIADDPTFSNVPFIQAKKLDVGVELLPFLVHHEVRITKLIIDTPSNSAELKHVMRKVEFFEPWREIQPNPNRNSKAAYPI